MSTVQTIASPVSTQVKARQPVLRVVRGGGDTRYLQIKDGKPGSYQTAAEMARLVREAAVRDQGLEKFAAQILINNGLDSHSDPDEAIDAIFRYTQQIKYISDSSGQGAFDAVASARTTIEKGYGDCDDLSVVLASLLALVGFRPAFVLAKMREESRGFDHVYVEVASKKGRVALDPTTRKYGMGWESPRIIEKVSYPIFRGPAASYIQGVAGLADQILPGLIQTGISIGGSLLQGAAKGNPAKTQGVQLGKGFDIDDKAVAAFLVTLNTKATAGTLTAADYMAAQNAVSTLEQEAQAGSGVAYIRSQWASEGPRYAQWLQALGAKVVPDTVAALSSNSNVGIGAAGAGVGAGAGSGLLGDSGVLSLPVLLLIGVGAFILLRR